MELKVKKLNEKARLPYYATSGSAGMDLTACIDEPIIIKAHERALVPTGFAIEMESNLYGAFIFARSGLATKHGITMANGVGVIDSDYRGEIKVSLMNTSDVDFKIEDGDRVAQMVLLPVEIAKIVITDTLSDSQRGEGGFGSTGKR